MKRSVIKIFILSTFLIFSCTNYSNVNNEKERKKFIFEQLTWQERMFGHYYTLEHFLYEWKRDSTCCLGLRDDKKAQLIGDSVIMKYPKLSYILERIGPPSIYEKVSYDSTSDYPHDIYLRYYYGYNLCKDGKVDERVELCWMYVWALAEKDSIVYYGFNCQ